MSDQEIKGPYLQEIKGPYLFLILLLYFSVLVTTSHCFYCICKINLVTGRACLSIIFFFFESILTILGYCIFICILLIFTKKPVTVLISIVLNVYNYLGGKELKFLPYKVFQLPFLFLILVICHSSFLFSALVGVLHFNNSLNLNKYSDRPPLGGCGKNNVL